MKSLACVLLLLATMGAFVTLKIRSIDIMKPTVDGWKIFRTFNYPELPTLP